MFTVWTCYFWYKLYSVRRFVLVDFVQSTCHDEDFYVLHCTWRRFVNMLVLIDAVASHPVPVFVKLDVPYLAALNTCEHNYNSDYDEWVLTQRSVKDPLLAKLNSIIILYVQRPWMSLAIAKTISEHGVNIKKDIRILWFLFISIASYPSDWGFSRE